MVMEVLSSPGKISMSDRCFARISGFIQSNFGIKLPEVKKTMVESRLQKRLRVLGLRSFDEYGDFVFSPEGMSEELTHMVDLITTNKTDFFREPSHFQYLYNTVVPELIKTSGAGMRKPLRVWSAGCSSGEEPYSLAMVLSEYAAQKPGFDFNILGTDISVRILEKALNGIYREEVAEPVPLPMRKKYLLRSTSREEPLVRIKPALRSKVRFKRLNLMAPHPETGILMDIIFCRNVIIYFERVVQEEIVHKLCRRLVGGGFLFLGHSETLHGMSLPLRVVAPMVYRKEL